MYSIFVYLLYTCIVYLSTYKEATVSRVPFGIVEVITWKIAWSPP